MPGIVRLSIVLLPVPLVCLALVLWGPIPQDAGYHQFADERSVCGIPRFGDVVSNLPFVLVGACGLWASAARWRVGPTGEFTEAWERVPYGVFFTGVLLTGFGSAYYHWAPDADRLFWDRLPLSPAFMALFVIVIGERISPRLARRLFWPVVCIGPASVVYWHLGEQRGAGDLRPYGAVQFYPMLVTPLILTLFPSRYTQGGRLWGVFAAYVAAKLCEHLDRPICEMLGIVSGHTLKHLLAGVSAWCVLRAVQGRRAVTPLR